MIILQINKTKNSKNISLIQRDVIKTYNLQNSSI